MTLTQINKAGLDELALDHVFTIGASGTDHYTFQGEGLNGTVNDPTLYLTRGKTYRFENGTGAHAIRIQSADNGTSGTLYNTGVTNNNTTGTVIVEVQHDAPDVLYYQCASHANMKGILYITGALADGGVTTAKLADQSVTTAKLANQAAGTDQIAHGAVVTLKIADANVTTAKLAADAVNGTKIADDAIANEHIAANAVQTAQIANGNVTLDKMAASSVNSAQIVANAVQTAAIADDAVTAAKIADGTITSTQIANDAVTRSRIQDEAVDADRLAASAVTTAKIADQAVTLAKLPHGDGSNDGKFLRANNGADPTFETVTGTTINSNADNRLITGSGTANTLNAESSGTFSSGQLKILTDGASGSGIRLVGKSGNSGSEIDFVNNADNSNLGYIEFSDAGVRVWNLTNTDMHFRTNNTERLRILAGGGLTFNGDTAAANALDDYEEGSFTAQFSAAGSLNQTTTSGYYIKVGSMVHVQGEIFWNNNGTGSNSVYVNLPFINRASRGGLAIGLQSGMDVDGDHQLYMMPELDSTVAYLLMSKDNDPAGGHSHIRGDDIRNYASRGFSFGGTYYTNV